MNLDRILFELGVPLNLSGYDYIKTATGLIAEDESLFKYGKICKLYEAVAKQHGTTWQRAERNVRNAVDKSLASIRGRIQDGTFDTEKYYRFAQNPYMNASTYLSALYMSIKEVAADESL